MRCAVDPGSWRPRVNGQSSCRMNGNATCSTAPVTTRARHRAPRTTSHSGSVRRGRHDERSLVAGSAVTLAVWVMRPPGSGGVERTGRAPDSALPHHGSPSTCTVTGTSMPGPGASRIGYVLQDRATGATKGTGRSRMPEGHTIHALADRLDRAFRGHEVEASSPQGRFAADAERLDGRVFERAQAWGKHLFVDIGDATLHVHLGLIGMFPVKHLDGDRPPAPVGAVRLRLVGPEHWADLRGPMICTLVDRARQREIVATLGPDPLRRGARADPGWARVQQSRRTVAELLMDQSVVAGATMRRATVRACQHRNRPARPATDRPSSTSTRASHARQTRTA